MVKHVQPTQAHHHNDCDICSEQQQSFRACVALACPSFVPSLHTGPAPGLRPSCTTQGSYGAELPHAYQNSSYLVLFEHKSHCLSLLQNLAQDMLVVAVTYFALFGIQPIEETDPGICRRILDRL